MNPEPAHALQPPAAPAAMSEERYVQASAESCGPAALEGLLRVHTMTQHYELGIGYWEAWAGATGSSPAAALQIQHLRSGTFAKLCLAVDTSTSTQVALKYIDRRKLVRGLAVRARARGRAKSGDGWQLS